MTNLRAGGEKAAGAAFLRGIIGFAVKRPIEMEGEGRTGAARGAANFQRGPCYRPAAFVAPWRVHDDSNRQILILRLKFRVHPQKFLPPVLHPHKAAEARVFVLQPDMKLTQSRAVRTYCVALL
jgi:hypothetical protein